MYPPFTVKYCDKKGFISNMVKKFALEAYYPSNDCI
ncbi:hypothetical protein SAMN05421734_101108 [Pelagirhabdus alkalitolerans]|uniref:Uncharacterized protein n=1 Tax=Pelagirhabdus alkalitolerans TaxID=1612202 RepID=A0A1G6GHQ1_9BACI|nr:hypothetical protein SAMN05421734_101108 [Pelagirhabdus alkalitolerans]